LGELELTFRSENNGPPNIGVVLTDPRGRRFGFDPVTKKSWDELPVAQGFIDCDQSHAGVSCQGIVDVCGPVSGVYKLEVIGLKTSVYGVGVSTRSKRVNFGNRFYNSFSQADVKDVGARMGSRDILVLDYSRDPEAKIAVQIEPTLKAHQTSNRRPAAED
jgi:hypothetical protein